MPDDMLESDRPRITMIDPQNFRGSTFTPDPNAARRPILPAIPLPKQGPNDMKTSFLGALQSIIIVLGSVFGVPQIHVDNPEMQLTAQIAMVVYAVIVFVKSLITADAESKNMKTPIVPIQGE